MTLGIALGIVQMMLRWLVDVYGMADSRYSKRHYSMVYWKGVLWSSIRYYIKDY